MRQRGSHGRLRYPGRRVPLVVPLYRELKRGTLAGILRDADIGPDDLRHCSGSPDETDRLATGVRARMSLADGRRSHSSGLPFIITSRQPGWEKGLQGTPVEVEAGGVRDVRSACARRSALWPQPALSVRENERIVDLFTENLSRYLAGDPLIGRVDPTLFY